MNYKREAVGNGGTEDTQVGREYPSLEGTGRCYRGTICPRGFLR